MATRPQRELALAMDVALGILVQSRDRVAFLSRPLQLIARPAAHVMLRPPLVPLGLQPASWLKRAAIRGAAYRNETLHELDAVLDRLLPALLAEVMRHVDVTDLLHENVDVVALAEGVIAEIDLPEIIRDSTGAMASDTVLGVRMQSISGDDAIARAMDRLRFRLARGTADPGAAEPIPLPEATAVPPPVTDPPARAR